MGCKKHGHDCSHPLDEDAPKVVGRGSISRSAIEATERQTQCSGRVPKNYRFGRRVGVRKHDNSMRRQRLREAAVEGGCVIQWGDQ
jgi:hypothetical protein